MTGYRLSDLQSVPDCATAIALGTALTLYQHAPVQVASLLSSSLVRSLENGSYLFAFSTVNLYRRS